MATAKKMPWRRQEKPSIPAHLMESLTEFRQDDSERNLACTPPADEAIHLGCIWVFEAYQPPDAARLLESLHKLGWDAPSPLSASGDIGDWVQEARRHPYGGGWHSLGIIGREGEPSRHRERHAKLPDGVDYLHAGIIQSIPSVTLLGIQFVFDEATQAALEPPLRASYTTTIEPHGRMYAFPGPAEHKRRAVDRVRRELRARCTTWFSGNLPGTFAGGLLDGQYPTAELILTNLAEPFEEEIGADLYGSYMTVLQLAQPWDAWKVEDRSFTGLRLGFPDRRADDRNHMILAARHSDLAESTGLRDFERSVRGVVSHASFLERTISRWALSELVRGHERRLADLRDAALSIDATATEGAAQRLRLVERELSELARSTPFLSAEVRRFCRRKGSFFWDVAEFTPLKPRGENDVALFEGMREALQDRSRQLERITSDVRTAVVTTSNIVNAIANERTAHSNMVLQRRVLWMTAFTIVLTILGVAIALLQLIE